MCRLETEVNLIVNTLAACLCLILPIIYTMCRIPISSPTSLYISTAIQAVGASFQFLVFVEVMFWTGEWCLFQSRMRYSETMIWDADWQHGLILSTTFYQPQIQMFRLLKGTWDRFADNSADPAGTWEQIAHLLKLQARFQLGYRDEVEQLDEYLGWEKRRAVRRGIFQRLFSTPKYQDSGSISWLEGRGTANLKILWETLEIRARTLPVIARYTEIAEHGTDAVKRAFLVESMCAEYLIVKKNMHLFHSKGWSEWLGVSETEIDEKLLITCNSLRHIEGVWEKLETKGHELAMMSWFKRV
ncbi:hypothetical protein VTL71DRAFT_14853 [Oculimacula yallundae]|uniref:Uncharacterized protein n=1 Tax=Oculimacula yallundae TaxID=86028 RepID=A0ABR4CEX4_9HELO